MAEEIVARVLERLQRPRHQVDEKRAELCAQLEAVERRIENLAAAIAVAGHSQALLTALRTTEAERAHLTKALDSIDRVAKLHPADETKMIAELRRRLEDWRGLLRRNPMAGGQVLRKLLAERLVITEQARDGVRGWLIEGKTRPENLLAGSVLLQR